RFRALALAQGPQGSLEEPFDVGAQAACGTRRGRGRDLPRVHARAPRQRPPPAGRRCREAAEEEVAGIITAKRTASSVRGKLVRHPGVAYLAVALLHRRPGDTMGDLLDPPGLTAGVR